MSAVGKPSQTENDSVGLLATGSSGSWDISIDETLSGDERWFAQIEGPALYLYFELPSLDAIGKAIRFLSPAAEKAEVSSASPRNNCELMLSKAGEVPIRLVRDDEFEDRCFVVLGQADRPVMRYALSADDTSDIFEALRQAEDDLPHHDSAV